MALSESKIYHSTEALSVRLSVKYLIILGQVPSLEITFLGHLVVTETSLTEQDMIGIDPPTPGPSHAIELGVRHGFHVLEAHEATLSQDFAAALQLLSTPPTQSGWVDLI